MRFLPLYLFFVIISSCTSQSYKNYIKQGNIKSKSKDYIGAIEDYSKAIELDTKVPEGYFYRGLAHFNFKHFAPAASDFNTAINLKFDYAVAHYYKGLNRIFAEQDRLDKAFPLIPPPPWTPVEEQAIVDFNNAIKYDANLVDAYIYRGFSKFKLKDYHEAIKDYNVAISLNPKYSIAYHYRGSSKFRLKDKDGACSDWKKAIDLGYEGSKILYSNNCESAK